MACCLFFSAKLVLSKEIVFVLQCEKIENLKQKIKCLRFAQKLSQIFAHIYCCEIFCNRNEKEKGIQRRTCGTPKLKLNVSNALHLLKEASLMGTVGPYVRLQKVPGSP